MRDLFRMFPRVAVFRALILNFEKKKIDTKNVKLQTFCAEIYAIPSPSDV